MRVIEEIARSKLASRRRDLSQSVVLFIMTFLVFRIEVSNGRASRLSKSAHSQLQPRSSDR